MRCGRCQDHLDAYVEGLLPSAEREAIETHLADCTVCRAELDSIHRLLGLMPYAADIQPPPELAEMIRTRVKPVWYQRWSAGLKWPVWVPASVLLIVLASWFLWRPIAVQEPTDQEIAQALAEVQYALSVVQYAAGKTGYTLQDLERQFHPSQQLEQPVRLAGEATGEGVSRGLSLALVPLKRITSFGWRSSP